MSGKSLKEMIEYTETIPEIKSIKDVALENSLWNIRFILPEQKQLIDGAFVKEFFIDKDNCQICFIVTVYEKAYPYIMHDATGGSPQFLTDEMSIDFEKIPENYAKIPEIRIEYLDRFGDVKEYDTYINCSFEKMLEIYDYSGSLVRNKLLIFNYENVNLI